MSFGEFLPIPLLALFLSACGAESSAVVCDGCNHTEPPEAVVGAPEGRPSAAASNDGTIWVSFHDATFGALVVGRFEAGTLAARTRVDDGSARADDVGHQPSLVLDSANRPAVAYTSASGELRLARLNGGWTIESLEVAGVMSPSLAADGQGGLHLAYRDRGAKDLRFSSLSDAGCHAVGWQPGAGPLPRIVSRADMEAAGMASQDYGEFASTAVSAAGAIITSFYDRTRGNLVLATCVGDVADLRIIDGEDPEKGVDTGDVGLWSSLAVDPLTGRVGIAYFDRSRGVLKYATSDQGVPIVTVVDGGGSELGPFTRYVGQGAQLAFGFEAGLQNGLPRIVYVDASLGQLLLASRDPFEVWASRVVVPMSASPGSGYTLAITGGGDATAFVITTNGAGQSELLSCTGLECKP